MIAVPTKPSAASTPEGMAFLKDRVKDSRDRLVAVAAVATRKPSRKVTREVKNLEYLDRVRMWIDNTQIKLMNEKVCMCACMRLCVCVYV